MVETLEVGKDDRGMLRSEYDRLSAAGIDMAWAYRVEYHSAGLVKVFRYALREQKWPDGTPYEGGHAPYIDPETGAIAVADPTWHRVAS